MLHKPCVHVTRHDNTPNSFLHKQCVVHLRVHAPAIDRIVGLQLLLNCMFARCKSNKTSTNSTGSCDQIVSLRPHRLHASAAEPSPPLHQVKCRSTRRAIDPTRCAASTCNDLTRTSPRIDCSDAICARINRNTTVRRRVACRRGRAMAPLSPREPSCAPKERARTAHNFACKEVHYHSLRTCTSIARVTMAATSRLSPHRLPIGR